LNNGGFFSTFNIQIQIESLLQDTKIAEELLLNLSKRNCDNNGVLCDIMDGKMYRRLNLRNNELTCSVNTDGVPIFKSSKFSIWPVIISINELSYHTRSKHSLVVALWFGKSKPDFDIFFNPFVQECASLSKSGVKWEVDGRIISSPVFFPIMVNDSVARCLCQGVHQFNGSFGCTWCLMEGESCIVDGCASTKRIYKGPLQSPLRTAENFLGHLKEFRNLLDRNPSLKSHFGIKSAPKLLLMPKFDIVSGFTFDYMHTAFLGVSRTFLELWLDSKNHKKQYYIGREIQEIDERLLQFSVPYNFDRAVRSITERKF